jgi:hypothetical protein
LKKDNRKISLDARYQQVHEQILSGPGRELQEAIDSGAAWKQGSTSKQAMDALAEGSAVVPAQQHKSYYGAPIPSYEDIDDEVGSTGSVANAEAYTNKQKEEP